MSKIRFIVLITLSDTKHDHRLHVIKNSNLDVCPWDKLDFDSFLGPEYNVNYHDYSLGSVDRFQDEIPQDGAQRSLQLQHGEPLPYTVPGTRAER
jgi:hypothetical protein